MASYSLRQKNLVERAKAEAEPLIKGKGKYRSDFDNVLKITGKYRNKAYKNGLDFAEFMVYRVKGKRVQGDTDITAVAKNRINKRFKKSVLSAQKQYNLRFEQMKLFPVRVSQNKRDMYFKEYKNTILRALQALIEDSGQEGTQNVYSKV